LLDEGIRDPISRTLDDTKQEPVRRIEASFRTLASFVADCKKSTMARSAISEVTRIIAPHVADGNLIEFLAFGDFGRDDVPNSVPGQFFRLLSASYQDRIDVLRKIQESGWNAPETFELLSLQLLVNIAQRDQSVKLKLQVEDGAKWIEEFQCVFGNQSIADVRSAIDALKGRFKQVRQLKTKLRRSAGIEAFCYELEKQTEEQGETIESLRRSLQVSVKDGETLQQHFDAQTRELAAMESSFKDFQQESSKQQEKLLNDISSCEKRLVSQNHQIEELLNQLSQSGTSAQTIAGENAGLREKCDKLSCACKKLQADLSASQRENRKKQTVATGQTEAEVVRLTSIHRDLKSRLRSAIEMAKSQVAENKYLSDELEALQRDHSTQAEAVSRLAIANKALTFQLESITDQVSRDRNVIAAQFRLKSLSEETKRQEELTVMRNQYASQIGSIMLALQNEFDELDSLTPDQLGSSEFFEAIRAIGHRCRGTFERF
jgi:hypothetical protein